MRGIGGIAVAESLPEVLVVLAAAVTTLADTWFVFALLTSLYWFLPARWSPQPRRRMVTLMALATCTLAAVSTLKYGFAAPRPPGAAVPAWLPDLAATWFENTVSASGFGFPSGHAAGATVLYGGLALLLDWGNRRRRAIVFGSVAVAVALSRVAIQVHYLVDVVAGALLGGVFLFGGLHLAGGALRRLLRDSDAADDDSESRVGGIHTQLDPTPVFLLAGVIAIAGVFVSNAGGFHEGVLESAVGVGTAIGGVGGWRLVDGDEPTVRPLVALPGLLVAGGFWFGALALEPPAVLAVILSALGIGIIVVLPTISLD